MTFVRRRINVNFSLGTGNFGESGSNGVNLTGLRVIAKIVKAGGAGMGQASLQIYGMPLAMMNQLSTLGMVILPVDTPRRNTVTVEAGDDVNGMSMVFQGTIKSAYSDMQAMPDVPFRVEAVVGLIEAVKPETPLSYSGPTKAADVMSTLADKMGLAFENNNVTTVLNAPYFWGSARNMAKSVADAAGIEWIIDNGKLAIWPRGEARPGVKLVAPPPLGKMVGYPSWTSKGILVTTEFDRPVEFGSKIEVQSDITPACGEWVIYLLTYDLASELPNGPWYCAMAAARPGLTPVAR